MPVSVRRHTTLALVLVVAAACSPKESGDRPTGAPVPTPTPKSTAELHLPIEAYLLDYEHQGKLEVLYLRLRDDCVKKKGFTPPAASVTGERAAGRYVRLWRYYDTRRYAISDSATAREYGYHLPPFTRGSAEPISFGSLSKPLRNAVLKCGGEAEKRESASAGEDKGGTEKLAADLRAKDFTQSQSDPRVLDVFQKWSACMARKGYHYPTPVDAAKDRQWKESGQRTPEALRAEVTPQETRTAVAEVDCVHETNLLGVSFAVEAEYENKDIEKNAEALNKLKTRNERASRKIDELWAQSG